MYKIGRPLGRDFYWWLSGLIDGEGYIGVDNRLRPAMQVCLSNDDKDVLDWACGYSRLGKVYVKSPQGNGRSQAAWMVRKVHDLLSLVDILDEFPLQSRKFVQYPFWRASVIEMVKPLVDRDLQLLKSHRATLISEHY